MTHTSHHSIITQLECIPYVACHITRHKCQKQYISSKRHLLTDIPRKALFFSYSFNISDHSCEQDRREEEINTSGSIQTSCHMTQVILKLRFTEWKDFRTIEVGFHTYKKCAGIYSTSWCQWMTATHTLNGM